MDPRVGRFTGVDPHSGIPTLPLTLHKYVYAADDGVNKIDPSGRFFAAQGFTALSIVSTLSSISSLAVNPVRSQVPVSLATEILLQEHSKWDEASALQAFNGAQAIWANEAGIFIRATAVRRIPNNPILAWVPALDDQYAQARAYIDTHARTNHVTVLVEDVRRVPFGIVVIPVAGRSSLGKEANGRGYSFVGREDSRVLAHEWGHTLKLGDFEVTGDDYLMVRGSRGTGFRPDQRERARAYARTY